MEHKNQFFFSARDQLASPGFDKPARRMAETVLVTGVSGFIGAHVAKSALAAGFAVKGTVRSDA